MKGNNLFMLGILGVLSGVCIFFHPWMLYFSLLLFFCLVLTRKIFKTNEANFLIKVILAAVSLRLLAVLIIRPFVLLYGNGIDIFGDGMAFGLNGFIISESLKQDLTQLRNQSLLNEYLFKTLPLYRIHTTNLRTALPYWAGSLPNFSVYQVTAYAYFLSFLYSFFGFKPVIAIFFNCLVGSFLCIPVYIITKDLTDNNICARTAAVLITFFPSLFLWSMLNQKEILSILLNILIVLCLIKFYKERRIILPIFVLFLTLIQFFLRPVFIAPLGIYYILFALIFLWQFKPARKALVLAMVFLVISGRFFSLPRNYLNKTMEKVYFLTVDALATHHSHVREGGSSYKILKERYYLPSPPGKPVAYWFQQGVPIKDISRAYFLGMYHFIFEPFPFNTRTSLQLLAYPQTILTYFLMIFFFLGFLVTLRYKTKLFFILFSYLFVFSSIVALNEGNVGGLLRHRDIVSWVFIIFASIGIVKLLGFKGKRYGLQNLPE